MSRHIPALDGLRGIAILTVLLLHFSVLPSGPGLDGVVGGLFATGWVGVDLFFVLSGFLITGILLDTRHDPHQLRNFYMRRSLRIFPLYFAYLAALFVVLPALSGSYASEHVPADRRWWFWSYLGNVLMGRVGWEGMPSHTTHLWSLAVEEQFYLIWPVLLLGVPRHRLAHLCVGAIATAWAARSVYVLMEHRPVAAYVLTICRMDTLAIGGLLAVQHRTGQRWLTPRRLVAAGTALLLAATVWNVVHGRRHLLEALDPVIQLVAYGGVALLCGALLHRAVHCEIGGRFHALLTSTWLRGFGTYSYALYLLHVPLRNVARQAVDRLGGLPVLAGSRLPAQLGLWVAGIALSYALAALSWRFFERPILSFKDRFASPKPVAIHPTSGEPSSRAA